MASTAGSTLVALLATDAWRQAKDGLTALWRRARPDRAEAVGAELQSCREDLLAVDGQGGRQTQMELTAEWQGRIRRLLNGHPELADELRRLMAGWDGAAHGASSISQHATASGQSRIYQSGRDMHVGQQ